MAGQLRGDKAFFMDPFYTAENTNPAYQLNWSVSLFGRTPLPRLGDWLGTLKEALEPDGVRILEFRSIRPNTCQFFVSTRPYVAPAEVLRVIKGRWQHQFRDAIPRMFRRNYSIVSVGEAHCQELDQYIATQTDRHVMADLRIQRELEELQFHDPTIDLKQIRATSHGEYVYGLHVVIEKERGWQETRRELLNGSLETIRAVAKNSDWLLSRVGVLTDHLHILLGPAITDAPQTVALTLLNHLACAPDLTPTFRYSYFVGTFGKYDRNAIRHHV